MRTAAQRNGGRNGKAAVLSPDTPDVEIKSASDVVGLLSDTISQVRRGQVDVKIANSVAYLCGHILKAREQGDLEDRLAAIEHRVATMATRSRQDP